jgi:predicted GH43/DUF377 family glycosyl hydrolase
LVLGPEKPYERFGDVGNVVFPCEYTIGPDGDTLNLYYGAAESCMAVARANLGEFLDGLDQRGEDPTLGAR